MGSTHHRGREEPSTFKPSSLQRGREEDDEVEQAQQQMVYHYTSAQQADDNNNNRHRTSSTATTATTSKRSLAATSDKSDGSNAFSQYGLPLGVNYPYQRHHVLVGDDGSEKMYGSALGLLTRKFLDHIMSSQSASVDMNESAFHLQVPKRRIYDITNVLEGVGILEKKSKNVVAWKGSELILGNAIEPDARKELERLRAEITQVTKEEAYVDKWSAHLVKQAAEADSNAELPKSINSTDIVQAIFYPKGQTGQLSTRASLVDETGRPRRAILAVHAPYDSVAYIPSSSANDTSETAVERHLYIGTRSGLERYPDGSTTTTTATKKQKIVSLHPNGRKVSNSSDDVVQVYAFSLYFDEREHTLKASDIRILTTPEDPDLQGEEAADESLPGPESPSGDYDNRRQTSWEAAASAYAQKDGVSEYFGTATAHEEPSTETIA